MAGLARTTRTLVALATAAAAAAAARSAGERVPTFDREVVRILQENCQTCHRPGDIAPFPLLTYEDAATHAGAIATQTAARRMPPWQPDPGLGEFVGDRRLSDRDIDTLARWAAGGAPEGDPAHLAKPITFTSDSTLGPPDAVLTYGEDFTPPLGADTYRCFPLPTSFAGDRWIRAVDVHPGDRATVHHAILYLDESGAALDADAAEAGPGYTCFGGAGVPVTGAIGGWAPGVRPFAAGDGAGILLPAGATVVLQVHYHPNGSALPDRTQVGLYFLDHAPGAAIQILPVGRTDFTIPAGDGAYAVTASATLPSFLGVTVYSVAPHMHLLGKSIAVDAFLPDGTTRSLVRISDWDFHWQAAYNLLRPAPLPGGTRIEVRTVYDNSAANPANPSSPPVPVSYGEATTDEMGWAFLGVAFGERGAPLRAPEVTGVSIDRRGRLLVKGRGIRRGARIEVDGAPIADSLGGRSLSSAAAWEDAVPQGVPVEVSVRNPDGHLSLPRSFTR